MDSVAGARAVAERMELVLASAVRTGRWAALAGRRRTTPRSLADGWADPECVRLLAAGAVGRCWSVLVGGILTLQRRPGRPTRQWGRVSATPLPSRCCWRRSGAHAGDLTVTFTNRRPAARRLWSVG